MNKLTRKNYCGSLLIGFTNLIVDPKLQKELLVPQTDGTTGAAKMASLQGSLFVKHLLMTFFGRDGSAIATQAGRIQEVF